MKSGEKIHRNGGEGKVKVKVENENENENENVNDGIAKLLNSKLLTLKTLNLKP